MSGGDKADGKRCENLLTWTESLYEDLLQANVICVVIGRENETAKEREAIRRKRIFYHWRVWQASLDKRHTLEARSE